MNKKTLYFIEFIWLFVLLIVFSLDYLSQWNIELNFNSDIILLPSLFKDLLVNHNHYRDWFLSPAPHFFPDAFLFFLIVLLAKNVYLEFLIFKWIRVIMTYYIVKYLYNQFFTKKMSIFFSLMVTSLLLIFSLREYLPYFTFLIPVHESELIIGLFLITIVIRLIDDSNSREKNLIFSIIFSVLVVLSSASNLLFVVQFSIPFIFTFILLYIKKWINLKKFLFLSSLCILATIGGDILAKYLVPHQVLFTYLNNPSLKKITLSTITLQISEFSKLFKSVGYLPWYIFIIFYLSIILILIFEIFNKKNKKNFFLSTFICLSVITSILSQYAMIKGLVAIRYILPFFYFPCLLFFFPLSILEKKIKLKKKLICVFSVIIIFTTIKLSIISFKKNLKPIFSYYPLKISCIDRHLPKNAHGLAEYWDANILSFLSKKKISIVPVTTLLEPLYWNMNSTVASKPSSFIILSHINPLFDLIPNIVFATYGPPRKIIQCGGKKILIYPENSLRPMKRPLFEHSGDSFNWTAASLPSLIPNSEKENNRIVQANGLKTFISYGPYILLPAGKYHFYIHYKSNEDSNNVVAFYDVYSTTIGEISKRFIYGSKSNRNEISGKFEVTQSQNYKHRFEIRVFFLGKSKFVLEDITLVRN